MNPLVSIIIPTYNRAHLIGETLDSVLAQTYTNWECIVVDDGSSDNTDEVIKQFIENDKRFRYFMRPSAMTKGPSSCRNYGFTVSIGEFIHWFDSDDLYFPCALEEFISFFGEKTDAVVAKLEKIEFGSKKKIGQNSILSNNVIEDYFVGKISFYVCGPLWRKSFLVKQKELFDENIRNLDDWDFNLRMLYQNPTIIYIDSPLMQYRYHENSLSKEIFKLNFVEIMSKFRAMEKHLDLIQKNRKSNLFALKTYYKNRCKFVLRMALLQKHDKRSFFFYKLVTQQLKLFDFTGVIKTILGYISYIFLGKGYVFFK
jgi:glycosyltransferase involved in cell wall biosynthesis